MKILEREPYLRELKAWLDEAAAWHGRIVFISGEAGIGKTILVSLFARSLEGTARVAVGRCDPLTTPRALGPLFDIADLLGGDVSALLETEAPQPRLFRGVLAGLGGPGRTVVVLEDVHWADEATLDLVRFLGRRIGTSRGMVVATYREDEVGPRHPLTAVLGDLATADGVRRMALPPLTSGAVEILARGSGLDPGELHHRTGGNPFYVTECLSAGTHGVPITVRDAVLARAARLAPRARRLLEAAAVIGAEADVELLRSAAGDDLKALDEVAASGMLRGSGRTVSFRHELARQAILGSLVPPRAQELHRAVLAALRSSSIASTDPGRLAHHAEAAGEVDAVLAFARAAGVRAAALGAHREAAAQFARALRSGEALPPAERAELLEAYAEQCWLTDRLDEAIAAQRDAERIWRAEGDPTRDAQALVRLARAFVRNGQNAEAEEASLRALEILEPRGPSRELGAAYRTRSMLLMMDRQNSVAVDWGTRAIALAERFDDQETQIMAHNFVGSALILSGRQAEGQRYLERSLTLAEEAERPDLAAWAYWNLGSASGEVYEFPTAERFLLQGIAYCAEHDLDTAQAYMQAWQALVELYQGRWEDAERRARLVLTRPGTAATSRIMALVALGRLQARRGDPDGVGTLDEALALALPTGTLQRVAPVRAARAEAAWLSGNLQAALDEARAGYALALSRAHPWFSGELAYWQWRAGAAPSLPEPCAEPFAREIAGDWAGASRAWTRLSCPYEGARALVDTSDADALREALGALKGLGARPLAAMVSRRLRAMGIRGIPRGPRPATRKHPAGLTPREAEIAALLAQGLRNPEIAARMHISVKTVDHHVSSVLAKLGVRTRAEVAREAARLGIVEHLQHDASHHPPPRVPKA